MRTWIRVSVLPAAAALGILGLACGDPSGPEAGQVSQAGGQTTVTVTAVDPDSVVQDTTLDIRVKGSGFDRGSIAEFLLNGQLDPRVRTNSTRYAKSTELVANVTVARDAVPTLYDVRVTTGGGKKGIGTEKLAVLTVNPEIAFSNGGLWVMNRDGSYKVQLSGLSAGTPSWSPDGDGTAASPYRLAYSPLGGGRVDVVSIMTTSGKPVGGTPVTIATNGPGFVAYPDWSPIGGEILYLRDGSIEIVSEDGATRYVAYTPTYPAVAVQPTWRWDGLKIAFIEDDDQFVSYPTRTIRIISRAAVGQPWSAPVTVYNDGIRDGGLFMLDWAHNHDWLLAAPSQVVSKLDLAAPTGWIPLASGNRSRWSPDDQELVLQQDSKIYRHNLATGARTTVGQRITCCVPAWRVPRRAP